MRCWRNQHNWRSAKDRKKECEGPKREKTRRASDSMNPNQGPPNHKPDPSRWEIVCN